MANGRTAARPAGIRHVPMTPMELLEEEVGHLMTWPGGLPKNSGPHPAFLVKPGQTGVKPPSKLDLPDKAQIVHSICCVFHATIHNI
jgi:hypothetical protein